MAFLRYSTLAAALILAALCGSGLSNTFCPTNYYPIETECFLFVRELMAWDEAQANCLRLGGTLAQTLDQDCNTLASLLDYLQTDSQLNDTYIWLGGSDIDVEGHWRWLNGDHIRMSSLFWGPGQPNGGEGQNCLDLWYTNGLHRFNDLACAVALASICSAEPLPPSH